MTSIVRTFIPGSKWLYFKLYTGHKTADSILSNAISPIINNFKKQNLIDKWFFIRYADPESHIRIRFLVKKELYIGEIIRLFYKKLTTFLNDDRIWKIQIDTYNRELERYGYMLIEEAESIFCIDSEYTLAIIKNLNKIQNEDYRWMIALKMIDHFLSDFSYDISHKQQIISNLSDTFKKEFGFNKYNSKLFNIKFREHKNTVEFVLDNKIENTVFLDLCKLLPYKSKKMLPIIKKLKEKLKNDEIEIILTNLLSNYLHMMLNRLFCSKNRMHELILYDFLRRYYTSKLAKQKYNTTGK
jgi:thiopeptide-type bacteriocin biosynthesis protein